jgi:hypothetical protein
MTAMARKTAALSDTGPSASNPEAASSKGLSSTIGFDSAGTGNYIS